MKNPEAGAILGFSAMSALKRINSFRQNRDMLGPGIGGSAPPFGPPG